MKFKNTANNYVEETSLPFVWTLLFGSLYLLVKGLWGHAIISFILALFTFGISWLIYPFIAGDLVYNDYLKRGWVPVE